MDLRYLQAANNDANIIGLSLQGVIVALVLWALAAIFILAGVLHFTRLRRAFMQIVPPSLPNAEAIVLITGAMEIVGGIALLIPSLRAWAGLALTLYLVAVFPANVYAAKHDIRIAGLSSRPLWRRLVLQVLLGVVLIWATQFPTRLFS